MARRSIAQRIGSQGHRWLMAEISAHPNWIARSLDEDFGIDFEAELDEHGVLGEILKIQVKSVQQAQKRAGKVAVSIDRKYIRYAQACRYPVIFVLVEIGSGNAWYVWLQDWILHQRRGGTVSLLSKRSTRVWIPVAATLESGLDFELKRIAQWRGESQFVLSLVDALRAALGTHREALAKDVVELILRHAGNLAKISLDVIIREATILGDRMWATAEGNVVSNLLFSLARQLGGDISLDTVSDLVLRGDTYSRTGINTLSILYDCFPEHLKALHLSEYFLDCEPRVAFYCAFRESLDRGGYFTTPDADFSFAGVRFRSHERMLDKLANRGASAILDYLEPVGP